MDHRIQFQLADQLGQEGLPRIGVNELGPLEADARIGDVNAEDRLDVVPLLEAPCEMGSEVAGNARDENSPGSYG